jgi:ATP-dependent phosphoenolpyruvate carboxykinase
MFYLLLYSQSTDIWTFLAASLVCHGKYELHRVALNDALDNVPMTQDSVFRVHVPEHCPDVTDEVLQPIDTCADKEACRARTLEQVRAFHENLKQFDDHTADERKASAPGLSYA